MKTISPVILAILLSGILLLPASGTAAAGTDRPCEDRLLEANAKCYKGNCSEALPIYDELVGSIASCPDTVKGDVYYGRARAKEGAHDFQGAVADYDAAFTLNPNSKKFREGLSSGYFNRGNQRERLGNLKGAIEDYNKALLYNPDSQEAAAGVASYYFTKGSEKYQRGDLKGAQEDYKTALRYRPQYPELREAMRNLEERMRHKAAEKDGMFTF